MPRRVVDPQPASGLVQLRLDGVLDGLAERAAPVDPSEPARGLLGVVLALLGLGLVLQASHAATILAPRSLFGDNFTNTVPSSTASPCPPTAL